MARRLGAAILGIQLAIVGLAGCGQQAENVRADPLSAIDIGFSQAGSESDWRKANTQSIKDAAGQANVNLDFRNAEGDQRAQIDAIRSFIADDVDVIAFSPVVEAGYDEVLRQAREADIPVVVVDRTIETADQALYTSSLGADFRSEGYSVGAWLVQEFTDHAGPVNIVELRGAEGSTPALHRNEGFTEVIRAVPKLRVVASPYGRWTRADGRSAMARILRERDDIDVVFAHNDDMGLGAMAAIEAAGLEPGKDIKLVTVDATRDGMRALAAEKINFIVECNPLIGPDLMDLVSAIYLGANVDRRIVVKDGVFTPAAARSVLPDRKY